MRPWDFGGAADRSRVYRAILTMLPVRADNDVMLIVHVALALGSIGALPSRAAHDARSPHDSSALVRHDVAVDTELVWLDARMQILDAARPPDVRADTPIVVRAGRGTFHVRGGFSSRAVYDVEDGSL